VILVDTSVWIDHLRRGDAALVAMLDAGQAAIHDFIIGEIACGHLKARQRLLHLLALLPRVASATEEETLHFLEHRRLFGRGLGYIDAHLLAAVSLHAGAHLWTRDKRLDAIATELKLAY
jgi:predicted nucleic acid-binding protein